MSTAYPYITPCIIDALALVADVALKSLASTTDAEAAFRSDYGFDGPYSRCLELCRAWGYRPNGKATWYKALQDAETLGLLRRKVQPRGTFWSVKPPTAPHRATCRAVLALLGANDGARDAAQLLEALTTAPPRGVTPEHLEGHLAWALGRLLHEGRVSWRLSERFWRLVEVAEGPARLAQPITSAEVEPIVEAACNTAPPPAPPDEALPAPDEAPQTLLTPAQERRAARLAAERAARPPGIKGWSEPTSRRMSQQEVEVLHLLLRGPLVSPGTYLETILDELAAAGKVRREGQVWSLPGGAR